MIFLPSAAKDENVLKAVRMFVDSLAREDFDDALSMLDPWSPCAWDSNLIKNIIAHYGEIKPRADGKRFKVTPPAEAKPGDKPQKAEVTRWPERDHDGLKTVGQARYDLPLNGKWSNLSLVVDLIPHGGNIMLRINNITVLQDPPKKS